MCVSKDIKIEKLLSEKSTADKTETPKTLFKSFEEKINSLVLKKLRSLDNGQKFDSTFVLTLVRSLYANDLTVLLSRNVSGKGKSPITPAKKTIIHDMLNERVIAEETDETLATQRINRIGGLLNDAITNITRPLKRVI